MKKITVLIGSARKGGTYQAVKAFEAALKRHETVDFEPVFLSDYDLKFCNGCKLCFDEGEGKCPLKDDCDIIIDKIEQSDGVIFTSPNYAFQVSGRMKNFLDRTAFYFHRPAFFDQIVTAIVTQAVFGGAKIQKYLENRGDNYGFQVSKGTCVSTLEPMTDKQTQKLEKKVKKAAGAFFDFLGKLTVQ